MIRHHALRLVLTLTLLTGVYAGYALLAQLGPQLLGDEPLSRLPMIRLDATGH